MRSVWLLSIACLAAALLLSCDPEVKYVPATQTVFRIEADPSVRAALVSLRVRTALLRDGTWEARHDKTFAAEALRWPVEIVVLPRSEAEAGWQLELVAEALDAGGSVLVQARALTGFVLREGRLLVLKLSACGANPLGFVCEDDPACHGPACSTCVAGSCADTPFVAPGDLATIQPVTTEAGTDLDGSIDGSTDVDGSIDIDDMDGGMEEGGHDATTHPDVNVGEPEGGPDATGPRPCDPGSERDDAGACVDIDECTRKLDDCDDEPQACTNLVNGLGFSCGCPTGYRGDGHGQAGCADVDECMEQTDTCDALTMCNNAPGGYACGDCPAGYTPGAGGSCQDLDECATNNGGCDTEPTAGCMNRVGMPNTCDCPDGYTGNGVGGSGCSDENECLANNGGCDTSPTAACTNHLGAPRTCACPAGSTGTGVGASGCADIVDCTPTSCQHNGRCVEGVLGFTCDCAGTGYSGTTCQTDPCSPNPCGSGLTCTRTPAAMASCSASCARAGAGGCQPGDVCQTDADCRTGGDSNATCDATDKVCVTTCGTRSIVSQDNLDAARYCREITGDLTIEPDFATIPATALPYLTRVRGSVRSGSATGSAALQSITLGRLETVDGELGFGGFTSMTLASFPRLSSAGGISFILSNAVTRISLPQLTRVQGGFALGVLQNLTQVDIGRLNSISGSLTLRDLCKLPWTQVERIASFGSSQLVTMIGCCTMFTKHTTCGGSTGTCSCTQ
jgi:hypothetical protein